MLVTLAQGYLVLTFEAKGWAFPDRSSPRARLRLDGEPIATMTARGGAEVLMVILSARATSGGGSRTRRRSTWPPPVRWSRFPSAI
jgi:hypothetical protein